MGADKQPVSLSLKAFLATLMDNQARITRVVRAAIQLDDEKLSWELLVMTDRYTDEARVHQGGILPEFPAGVAFL